MKTLLTLLTVLALLSFASPALAGVRPGGRPRNLAYHERRLRALDQQRHALQVRNHRQRCGRY